MVFMNASEEILNDTHNPLSSASHTAVTIGSTTTPVLSANPKRRYVILINDSNEEIYIALGATATKNTGIRINANGGSFEMSRGIGNLYLGEIAGVSTSGNMTLLVTEGA